MRSLFLSKNAVSLPTAVQKLFPRIAPIRYRSKLRYPRLIRHVLSNKRRDQAHIHAAILRLIAEGGATIDPQVLLEYVESVLLLHYLQACNIEIFTMLKPPLMESLAQECVRVLEAGVVGDFVDVGVWKGGSSMIMKCVNDALGGGRHLYCLDLFDTMDARAVDAVDPVEDRLIIAALDLARDYFGTEGVTTSTEEFRRNFARFGVSLEGVTLLKGNLLSPDFPFDRLDKIALLRVDCDFYTATRNTLAHLYPKLQAGGTVIFDDYYLPAFGERAAADALRQSIGDTTPLLRVGQSAVWRLPA